MITFDTIRLEYDLSVLPYLLRQQAEAKLDSIKRQYGKSSIFLRDKRSPLELQYVEECEANDVKISVDSDKGVVITQKDINYYYLPSYSYKVLFVRQGTIVTIEFSIPKYLYGHNLNVFPNEEYFSYLYDDEREQIKHYLENSDEEGYVELVCLYHFLKVFTSKYFGVTFESLNPRLMRLDISYNCRFQPQDFELFRNNMQRVFSENVRQNRFVNYQNQTFSKVSQKWSVKVYNKEEEFFQHDYKKLKEYFGLPFFNFSAEKQAKKIDDLVAFSRNVWRCEISVRNSSMSDFFFDNYKSYDFPQKNQYDSNYEMYRRVENFRNSVIRLKKMFVYDINGKVDFLKTPPRCEIVMRNIFNKYNDIINERLMWSISDGLEVDWQKFADYLSFYFVENQPISECFFRPLVYSSYEICRKIRVGWKVKFFGDDEKTLCLDVRILRHFYCKMQQYVKSISHHQVNTLELLKVLRSKKNEDKKLVASIVGRKKNSFIDYLIAKRTRSNEKFYGYSKSTFLRNEAKVILFEKALDYNDDVEFDFEKIWQNTYITSQVEDSAEKIREFVRACGYCFDYNYLYSSFCEYLREYDVASVYDFSLSSQENFSNVIYWFNQYFAEMTEGLEVYDNFSYSDIEKLKFTEVYMSFENSLVKNI